MSLGKYYDGDGYVFYCYRDSDDTKYHLYEHRLLMYAWHELDSVFFSDDMREVHHVPIDGESLKDLNIRRYLAALTPQEHIDVDPNRARIQTAWDRQLQASD